MTTKGGKMTDEINVVDFQCSHWGHDFSVDSQKKRLVTAHGWYSSSIGMDINKYQLKKGRLLLNAVKTVGIGLEE